MPVLSITNLRATLTTSSVVVLILLTAISQAVAAGPVAQILAPDSGSKLRKGHKVDVTVHVDGSPAISWTVSLHPESSPPMVLASGSGTVAAATVAEVDADALAAGAFYTLTLSVIDGDANATAVATFTVPDPQYTLIPLEEGNLSHRGYFIYAADSSGDQVLYSPKTGDPFPLEVIHRQTGQRDAFSLRLDNTTGPKFSGDGTRLFYTGLFRQGGFTIFGLGYRDLNSGADVLLVDQSSNPFFTVDYLGQHVAFQTGAQYFFYDQTTSERRQLTTDPAAIDFNSGCTGQFGTIPLITDDGGTVVMITSATLGIVPPDPSIGCRIFAYDVASQNLRQVIALPNTLAQVLPALSGDGRWLSFAAVEGFPDGSSRGVPVLVDMQAATFSAPAADVGSYTTFDAVVTRDGGGIVISTQADLDPRVGNADHNLELFYFDRTTQQFTQMSETTGGAGRSPNGCGSYLPSISHDGGVAVFAFVLVSAEGCYVDGPQRNEADGFVFGFARAVRNRPGNNDVVFDAPPDQRVAAGDTLTLNLTATDPDGDPISFFAQEKDGIDVFPGSTITDNHDGTATFVWPTGPQDTGDHVLRVAAFDEGGGEVFHDVTISVVPGGAACTGDCNGDRQVTLDELLTGVAIVLGNSPATACAAYATPVTIAQLLAAVNNAMNGCPASGA